MNRKNQTKNILLLCFYLAMVGPATAQKIHGEVVGVTTIDDETVYEKLIGVNVYWSDVFEGTTTDENGHFSLKLNRELPAKLVFSYVGYINDTVALEAVPKEHVKVVLRSKEYKGVDIEGDLGHTFMSTMNPIGTEQINQGELERAACCNLSESFETNASVDVVESDAVSGTRKIRMLGLDGVYTQLQMENVPFVRGIASSTGLTSIPGTWVQSIQISKGAGSVVNGHEAITGQINVELLKPEKNDRLFVNLYGNHRGRFEGNFQYTTKAGEKWGSNAFLHLSGNRMKTDRNADNFLDMPNYTNVSFFNRWKYTGEKRMMQIMYRIVDERKQSGQKGFVYDRDFGTQNAYGIGINNRQYELFVKNGFLMPNHPGRSLGVLAKANYQELDTYFGNRAYKEAQRSGYINAIFQDKFKTTAHIWKTGMSFRYDHFNGSVNDSTWTREEVVPGAFFEYTFDNSNNFAFVAGMRADYHNLFGMKYSPRMHLKYNPAPLTVIRASGGKGFRTPNVYADNLGLLASNRTFVITEVPKAEDAWNMGGSIMRKFTLFGEEAFILTEYFHTIFENQLVADLDQSARTVVFYNLDGKSYADAWQTEMGFEPLEGLGVRLAYKFTEARTTLNNDLQQRPLVPKHRALVTLNWKTQNEIWQVDATTTYTGAARLPYTGDNDPQYQLEGQSQAYLKQHVQLTKQWRWFDSYIGVENLFDFRQENPILGYEDPFGKHFDASMIWGPVAGRVIYGGIRYKLK